MTRHPLTTLKTWFCSAGVGRTPLLGGRPDQKTLETFVKEDPVKGRFGPTSYRSPGPSPSATGTQMTLHPLRPTTTGPTSPAPGLLCVNERPGASPPSPPRHASEGPCPDARPWLIRRVRATRVQAERPRRSTRRALAPRPGWPASLAHIPWDGTGPPSALHGLLVPFLVGACRDVVRPSLPRRGGRRDLRRPRGV